MHTHSFNEEILDKTELWTLILMIASALTILSKVQMGAPG